MVCLGLRRRGSILVSALSSLGGNVSNLVFSDVACVPFYVCVGRRCIVLRACGSMLWLPLAFFLFGLSWFFSPFPSPSSVEFCIVF
jgi:hypothetical protein